MNKSKILIFFSCLLISYNVTFSQNEVSVNPLTGGGSAVIPIFSLSSGQVSIPVNLVYNGSGIKPNDVEGTAGMGWNLSAGGQINRVVKGLPDDIYKDNSSNIIYGWMNSANSAANSVNSFTIANNGSTCSNETSDISYINTYLSNGDTEPDQFFVNAPGLSCQLVYNRVDTTFHPLSYQDLIIHTSKDPTTKLIKSFTITNDKGIQYIFSSPDTVTQTTYLPTGSITQPSYFKNQYLQYQNGIMYSSTWYLTSIKDVNGNGALLDYISVPYTLGADSVGIYLPGSNSYNLQYRILTRNASRKMVRVRTINANISTDIMVFFWNTISNLISGSEITGQTLIDSVTVDGHHFKFFYDAVGYQLPSGHSYYRSFLRNFADYPADANLGNPPLSAHTPINYAFYYCGETVTPYSSTTVLPDSSSLKRDYWGYYSSLSSSTNLLPKVRMSAGTAGVPPYAIGVANTFNGTYYPDSTSNANAVARVADPVNVMAGSLNKIVNVLGGSTNIIYESNDYLDIPAGRVVQGGGIRVKQIIDSIGSHSTNNIVRNYSYINPSTGKSSGKPVTLPAFAFTIPYSGAATGNALWNANTILSAYDLSDEDHSIMYGFSTISQTGAGSTQYQYIIPATAWDLAAHADCIGCTVYDWTPTINYIARNNCASNYGPITNSINNYPFIPNTNYDFERGLLLKTISYNDSGAEVSESNYTYQRSYSPSSLTAFKYDNDPNGSLLTVAYNKYPIFYNTSELSTTVINKVFDSNLSTSRSDTTIYSYGSGYHKLLTQIKKTNSDRSITTSNIKYSKDYPGATGTGTNANATAVYNLNQENVNIPLETYAQVTRGGVTKTTNALLTLFKGVTPGVKTLYLPQKQLKLIQPDGISSFSPLSISGQTITYDATDYFTVANYDTYDDTGFPQTVDDAHNDTVTTLIDHNAHQPIAIFRNAASNEIAYSDFDSDNEGSYPYEFSAAGYSYYPPGSHAGSSLGMIPGQATFHTVAKNPTCQNYILSVWIYAITGGQLSITLDGGTTHTPLTYNGTSTWKYYEVKLPVGSLGSSFTVSFTTNQNIGIDDILFYPDVAEVTTATYHVLTHNKLDETNTNGISTYFTSDQWGRLLYIYDQDKNILQKTSFLNPSDVQAFAGLSITLPGNAASGVSESFSIAGANSYNGNGAMVTWHFGDGSTSTMPLTSSASHSYSSTGKMPLTATVTSPLFGTYNLGPDTLNVLSPPTVTLHYTNNTYSNGNVSSVHFQNQLYSGPDYDFTGGMAGSISPGIYTVTIQIPTGAKYSIGSGPTGAGYGTVQMFGCTGFYSCQTYSSTNTYSFLVDLSSCTSLTLEVDQALTCGF